MGQLLLDNLKPNERESMRLPLLLVLLLLRRRRMVLFQEASRYQFT
jgi:hypothetical protein